MGDRIENVRGIGAVRRIWTEPVATRVAGVSMGFGFAVMLCSLALEQYWFASAPCTADPGQGLIYLHGNGGDHRYLSAFQATALELMNFGSVLVVVLAMLLRLRKHWDWLSLWRNIRLFNAKDDPTHQFAWSLVAGAASAPVILVCVGAPILHRLVAAGFVWSFG